MAVTGDCPIIDRGLALRGACLACTGHPRTGRATYSRQTPLCLEGSAADHVFALLDGVLREVRTTADGRTQPVRLIRPGHLAGVEALSSPAYHATVEAVTRAAVCRIPVEEVRQYLAQHPDATTAILGELVADLRAAGETVLWIGALSAEERVLALLRMLVEHEEPGTLVTLPLNRMEMAEFLGLAHATVSRIIQALARKGVIEVSGTRVAVLACP